MPKEFYSTAQPLVVDNGTPNYVKDVNEWKNINLYCTHTSMLSLSVIPKSGIRLSHVFPVVSFQLQESITLVYWKGAIRMSSFQLTNNHNSTLHPYRCRLYIHIPTRDTGKQQWRFYNPYFWLAKLKDLAQDFEFELEIVFIVVNRGVFLRRWYLESRSGNREWYFAVRKIGKILNKSGKLACTSLLCMSCLK